MAKISEGLDVIIKTFMSALNQNSGNWFADLAHYPCLFYLNVSLSLAVRDWKVLSMTCGRKLLCYGLLVRN